MSMRLDCGEEAVERDVDDLDGTAEPRADLLREIDLEADELARGVLELPGDIADVGADDEVGGPGCRGQEYQRECRGD